MSQQQKRRVLLNRSQSSLILDYEAMMNATDTNDYTRQLVASALSIPAAKIETPPPKPSLPCNKKQLSLFLKSSLKSSSAPCSPTKSVSFNQHEDICLFRKAQTPLAISQRHIFWADEEDSSSSSSSSSSSDEDEHLALKFPNWPEKDIITAAAPRMIKVDKQHMELVDNTIYGKVSVRNLSYHKSVTVRYSWDFWASYENVQAHFFEGHRNYDVFEFSIPLHDQHKHLYFAIQYSVAEKDYWDNNDGRNYELEITSQQQKPSQHHFSARYDFSTASQPTSISCNPLPTDLSYTDLVNKYCFYSTTSKRSPIF